MFAGVMRDNEYLLSAYYSVVMPDNYLLLYDVPKPEAVGPVLREADRELDAICADIRIRMGGNCDRHRGPVPGLLRSSPIRSINAAARPQSFTPPTRVFPAACAKDYAPARRSVWKMAVPAGWRISAYCVWAASTAARRPRSSMEKTLRRGRYHNPET